MPIGNNLKSYRLESISSKLKFLLLKYLLITAAVTALVIILLSLSTAILLGESGSGYAIGVAIDPMQLIILGVQILCSLAIAYFIGPMSINAISQAQSGTYVGIKSLLLCWTAPWMLLTLIAALPDVSWTFIAINVMIAIVPALVTGPLAGRAMKKKLRGNAGDV